MTKSGRWRSQARNAASPSPASPASSTPGKSDNSPRRRARAKGSSSTISIRIAGIPSP